ncbi:MAG: hypothetical protein ACREQE_09095 [Candidatus Binataceae bacterium]
MPGLFDPHVHFGVSDTFGDDAMATDFQYDSRDCLIGGVTTIATTTLMEAIHCSNFIRAQSGAAKRAAGATSRSPASLIRWTR